MRKVQTQELIGRIVQSVEKDDRYHQGLIIKFSDGFVVNVVGHSDYSDMETYIEIGHGDRNED